MDNLYEQEMINGREMLSGKIKSLKTGKITSLKTGPNSTHLMALYI